MSLTGGNRNDVTQLVPLIDKIPAVSGVVGRPRRRPDALLADRGYDHDKYRRLLWQRGIRPVIAERGQPHGSGLGVFRWVGTRSYGLYLWHWPVFVLVVSALPSWKRDGASGWALGGIALAISIVAAALSYRFVEQPIRRRGFRGA